MDVPTELPSRRAECQISISAAQRTVFAEGAGLHTQEFVSLVPACG